MNIRVAVESLPELADRVIDQYLPDRASTPEEIEYTRRPLTLVEQILFAAPWSPEERAQLESLKASGKWVM